MLLLCGASRLGHGLHAPADACRARGWVSGSPYWPGFQRRGVGLPGAWVVLFIRAAAMYPAGASRSRPSSSASLLPWEDDPLGTGMMDDFVAGSPRPTCLRAYASPTSSPTPSQGSLPAWRATPWPDGFRTRWTTNRISWLPHFSTPFGPALPGRTLSPHPASGSPRGMQPVMPRSAARTARDERADRERLPARQVPP